MRGPLARVGPYVAVERSAGGGREERGDGAAERADGSHVRVVARDGRQPPLSQSSWPRSARSPGGGAANRRRDRCRADAPDAIVARAGADSSMPALILAGIELPDARLPGAIRSIVALGRYQLVIDDTPPRAGGPRPDGLKAKVIGVISVLLSVLFLGDVIERDGQRDILPVGIAISRVMAAQAFMSFPGPSPRPTGAHGHRAAPCQAPGPGRRRAPGSGGHPSASRAWAVSGPIAADGGGAWPGLCST